MPRRAFLGPRREGVPLRRPLISKVFSTCFGPSGIYSSSLLSEATEAMIFELFFLAPQKGRVSNDVKRVIGGAKTQPL